jgi:hypothetical protein
MKRELPIFLVFLTGLIMVIQYFVPHQYSEFLFTYANDFVIVVGILALPLGIYSLINGTIAKARHQKSERFYAVVTIGGFFFMIFTGLTRDHLTSTTSVFQHMFQNVVLPAQSTLFSTLAFYIASAAYRAFRVRTAIATVLLVTAFIVMLRIVPLPAPLSTWNSDLVRWILAVPNMAAKRAIIIGVGLGGIAYSMKILLGIERGYMGKD